MGKKNDSKVKAYASWMKDHGIRRTTGRCCVCNRIISLPTDRHWIGGNCK